MKEKKHKYLEDLLEDYITLIDEQAEMTSQIEKFQKKFDLHLPGDKNVTYKTADAEDLFKYHSHVKKYQERKKEIADELDELEVLLREFLVALQGGKITFDKKDDSDKSKSTYTFWVEANVLKYSH